jgi:hypothetical protein
MKQRLATWTREESDAKAVKAFRKASLALATHDEGVATGEYISISYFYFRVLVWAIVLTACFVCRPNRGQREVHPADLGAAS